MTQQTMRQSEPAGSLSRVVLVQAPPDVAWRVFTEQMGTWWPLATHKIGRTRAVDTVVEPRVGGRWYERGEDGSSCDWGRVLAWEPPARLVLAWQISPDWQYDPALQTEVEVRFLAEGKGTRVELEHRGLDRYGARQEEMLRIFGSDRGWSGLLASFARAAEMVSGT